MPGCRLLHVSDLHLGRQHAYLGERAEERRQEADRLLARLVDFALACRPALDAVLIAGDLFESAFPDEALAGAVIGDLNRLVEGGILPVTVPGNHDEISYPNGVYRRQAGRWPGVLVTSPLPALAHTLKAGGEVVNIYSFAYREGVSPHRLPPFSLAASGTQVGLFHLSLDPRATDRAPHASRAQLKKLGLDYAALGHQHRPERLDLAPGLAAYPGLIEGAGFEDPGRGAPLILQVAGGKVQLEEAEFPRRRIVEREVDLSALRDAEELRELVLALADPELILRLKLAGVAGFTPAVSFLAEELAGRFFHLELEEDYGMIDSARAEELARQDTVLGLFAERIRAAKAGAADPEERALLELAFRKGLDAFRREGRG